MRRLKTGQWAGLLLMLVAIVLVVWAGLSVASHASHTPAARHVMATRMMGVAYMVCDLAISSSLILLLLARHRSAPLWAERRLPGHGRWLWHFLVGLTILCYLSLAPTFLFFLIRLRK